jgi:hypothetical protein
MPRFILRYRGQGEKPAHDVEHLRGLKDTQVLDESSPRMLLVEAPEATVRTAVDAMPDWIVSQERTYSVPRPSPILERAKDLKPPK